MSIEARPDTDLAALHTTLQAAIRAELPGARQLRRRVHADPRVAGDELATLQLVLTQLAGPVEPVATTGALVRIGRPGPAVGVRAELDALPITEETGVAWASTNGAMHACGHDVHLAALVALTRAVSQVDGAPPMVAVFQPREETYPSGARDIVESGALERETVSAVVGVHIQPVLADGQIACTPGAVNAAADEFTVRMRGRAGHAAYPHLNRDAVLALAQCVVSLQQLVSRDTDPMVPSVLTVGAISAGEAANATPGTATARGIIRSMSESHRLTLHERLHEVAAGVAQVHGCTATVEITSGEPVLHNDPGLAAAAAEALGTAGYRIVDSLRSCGADDFAYYAARFPSLMLFVGVGDGQGPPLHHPAFLPDDMAVDRVAEAMLAGYIAAAGSAGARAAGY